MSSDNLPEAHRGRSAARRPTGNLPQTPTSTRPPGAPPTHRPGELRFQEGQGRHYWWGLIGDPVKARIAERVGPAIEWWAGQHHAEDPRPHAVVFGPRGLAVTTPTVNDAGRQAHRIEVRRFVPSSVRHALVRQQATRSRWARSARDRAGAPAGPADALQLELNESMRGFLGNLPVEAQERLQAPFTTTDAIQDSEFHYYGTDAELDVWCYLAGTRTVTFASGHRTLRAGGEPAEAGWVLTCRQAQVEQA